MNFLISITVIFLLIEVFTILLKCERNVIAYSICQYIMATGIIVMEAIIISYNGKLLTSLAIILAQLIYIVVITKEMKLYIKPKKDKKELEGNSNIEE